MRQLFIRKHLHLHNKKQTQGARSIPVGAGWWCAQKRDNGVFLYHASTDPEESFKGLSYWDMAHNARLLWAHGEEPISISENETSVKIYTNGTSAVLIKVC